MACESLRPARRTITTTMTSISTAAETFMAMSAHTPSRAPPLGWAAVGAYGNRGRVTGARDGADDHSRDQSYPMGKGSITFSESTRAGHSAVRGAHGPVGGGLGPFGVYLETMLRTSDRQSPGSRSQPS
ncbi:hypothetical protein GCM10010502_30770 [Kitasatospora aureofaciens]|uniref:Uncharacterized protein n=1 Tax=Kitasatospora aureofaciens TaxID=1894 RepID=A0A8H9HNH0_KITAU|nr:hypothetical protein GCM10010502_30770 [Kitasatospora aureofaciens]